MSIAYIISAYKRPEQLARLVSRLSTTMSSFFIHVDKRTDDAIYRQMVAGLRQVANVHFLERHTCYWGDFGHVRATLKGIRAICQFDIHCDYVVLLTGQDYPLRSNRRIEDFFGEHNGQQFIDHFPLPSKQWEGGGLQRTSYWYIRLYNRRFVLPKQIYLPIPTALRPALSKTACMAIGRKAPAGFRLFGGSSYWCLSRSCIEFIDRFVQEHRDFVRFFTYADVPDEMFFQTIVMNSPFSNWVVNDDLRYINWKDPDDGSPNILGQANYRSIVESSKLFARKFDVTIDAEILDMIDAAIMDDTDKSEQPKQFPADCYRAAR